jgi:hypothetical protein
MISTARHAKRSGHPVQLTSHRLRAGVMGALALTLAASGCAMPPGVGDEAEGEATAAIEIQDQGLVENRFAEFIPPDLLSFADAVGQLSGAFGQIKAGVAVLEELGVLLGVLDRKYRDPYVSIYKKIDEAVAQVLWRINGLDRANRHAVAMTAVENAISQARSGGAVDAIYNRDSHNAVNEALEPIQWERSFDDATTGQRRNRYDWKVLFTDAGEPTDPPGVYQAKENGRNVKVVYDWRLGLPQLLELIALRIQVIAAQDPEFSVRRSAFSDEFLKYKRELERVADRMREGIKCTGVHDGLELWVGCADTYTGAAQTAYYSLLPYLPGGIRGGGKLLVDVPLTIENLGKSMRLTVERAMPLAQIEEMIATMDSYANPGR